MHVADWQLPQSSTGQPPCKVIINKLLSILLAEFTVICHMQLQTSIQTCTP